MSTDQQKKDKLQAINDVFVALESNPEGVSVDPDIFEDVFNFIETALSNDDIDDVDIITDSDGFLRTDDDATFSIVTDAHGLSKIQNDTPDSTNYTVPMGKLEDYNPLANVRVGEPQEITDIENIVRMLIDPQGKNLDGHWSHTAFSWLVGVVSLTIHEAIAQGRTATLSDVASKLSSPKESLSSLIDVMVAKTLLPNDTAQHRIALAGQEMLNRSPEERASIHSTAMTHLLPYRLDQ